MLQLISAITWDPGFRGFLTVVLAVIILMGSVYLIIATNSGARLGFLISLTGLFGWMLIMGITWSIYGIGKLGPAPSWQVLEANYNDLTEAQTEVARGVPEPGVLPTAESILEANPELAAQFPQEEGIKPPTLGDLLGVQPDLQEDFKQYLPDGWELLSSSNPQTGEAQASASAYLVESKIFAQPADFIVLDAFSEGGKEKREADISVLDRAVFKAKRILTWPLGHPPHYAVVQVQRVIPQETQPGQAAPLPQADPEGDVVAVVMERDLGSKRLPSVGLTIFSLIGFAICCNSLHRRDNLVAEARAAVAKS